MTLEWLRRAKCDQTLVASRKIWESHCRRYKVIHSRPLFRGLPEMFYAVRCDESGETIISKHRKKTPAFKACEADAKGDN